MFTLHLEISTDEHELNVEETERLYVKTMEQAKDAAWDYAMDAVDGYCDSSDIHPLQVEKLAAGYCGIGSPRDLIKTAPSDDYPWVTVTTQDQLAALQAAEKAPPDIEITEPGERHAFAGRMDDSGQWDGWQLHQGSNGYVDGEATNCHVIDMHVTIGEPQLAVHISDHNLHDRVLYVPRPDGIALLKDASKTPEERMSALWKLAAEKGKAEGDPRVSEMDEAELFLSWPSDHPAAFGFLTSQQWLQEFEDAIAELE